MKLPTHSQRKLPYMTALISPASPKNLLNPYRIENQPQNKHSFEILKKEAQTAWSNSPRYKYMKNPDPRAPSNAHIKLMTPLTKRPASLITQLKTKHIPLANYLFRIDKALSPICLSCQQDEESIHHYILHCPAHHRATSTLRHRVVRY